MHTIKFSYKTTQLFFSQIFVFNLLSKTTQLFISKVTTIGINKHKYSYNKYQVPITNISSIHIKTDSCSYQICQLFISDKP